MENCWEGGVQDQGKLSGKGLANFISRRQCPFLLILKE